MNLERATRPLPVAFAASALALRASRAAGVTLVTIELLALFACGPSASTVGGAASETASTANLSIGHLAASPGMALAMACTPTGPELCYNAIDDNCNGVIDEGCGIGTGLLQFTVAWGDSPADVDLAVTCPNRETVSAANKNTASGFHLDRDCPADHCNGQNIENVYFEGGDPPRGHYVVEIALGDLHGAELPVKARFGARVGSRTFGADLLLSRPDPENPPAGAGAGAGAAAPKQTFAFDL